MICSPNPNQKRVQLELLILFGPNQRGKNRGEGGGQNDYGFVSLLISSREIGELLLTLKKSTVFMHEGKDWCRVVSSVVYTPSSFFICR